MHSAMTHRERILAAINHQPTDRIPTDYWAVPEFTQKLYHQLNISSAIEFAKALDLDLIMGVSPTLNPGRNGMWNIEMKQVPISGGIGYYEEPVENPLAKYDTIEEIEANYIWPTTDMYDYSGIKSQCEIYRREGFAIEGGYISLTYFYEMIRGTEQMLVDFAVNEDIAEYILFKLNEFSYAHTQKILEAADGLIDVSQVTDDFGTQHSLIMSPQMIERYLSKYYDQNVALVKSYGAHVFHHDDGAMTDALPWLIEKGAEILNPLQWHLPGWNLDALKKQYGQKLCFHGGIDNQYVLPFGSETDVKKEVEACIDALYSDKTGYILAPCHNIQANTPVENVITMYEHARKYASSTKG